MTDVDVFRFMTERRLVRLTGRRASTLRQLAQHLREVTGSSIFYHTHHQYLSHHFAGPVFYNDFAAWVSDALQERALGEQLAAIDILEFQAIRPLRVAMLDLIARRLDRPEPLGRACPPGDEFHFCESQSFIMPTGLVARSVPEFFAAMRHCSNVSLFYHVFEARLRLDRAGNDFSRWLAQAGAPEPSAEIDALDPYRVSLDELRSQIVAIGERAGRS